MKVPNRIDPLAQVLPNAELRYRKLFDTLKDGILIIDDTTGKIEEANPALLDLLGCTRDEILGKELWEIRAIIDKSALITAFSTLKEKGSFSYADLPLRTSTGKIVNVDFSCSAYRVNLDNILQCNFRDITQHKALEAELFEYQHSVAIAMREMMVTLAFLIEERDPYTAGHQQQVARLAVAIAHEMGLPAHNIEGMEAAALLHDIGKIAVPTEILTKPGELNNFEIAMLRNHAQAGFDALKNIHFPWPVAQTVLQHHERLDGSGYPNGLKGDSICEEARILAVADTIEAMTSLRPYRVGRGLEAALQFISDNKGSLFDAKVVDACLSLFKDARYIMSKPNGHTGASVKHLVAGPPPLPSDAA